MSHVPLPAVLVVCFLLGFWGVSALLGSKRSARRQQANDNARAEQAFQNQGANADGPPWFVTLGVPEDASFEAIQAAYRRLIRAYHPDRLEGLAPEIVALGQDKAKRINQAFEQARGLRGR